MNVGYARTSTVEQKAGFDAQVRALEAAGCEQDNIFREQVSSVGERLELRKALAFVRKGDEFVVTKIDRLARSTIDLMRILEELGRKQVRVKILELGMDTGTPTGKLMLTVLGGVAQFEREIMLERQREGIAKAKREGKYRGRKPLAEDKVENVLKLDRAGIDRSSIAEQLGIGIASVYRIVARQKAKAA